MKERRAAGWARNLTVRGFLLAFLLAVPLAGRGHAAPGDPDLTFGGDGLVAVDVETSDTAGAMVVTRDGGVLVAGGCRLLGRPTHGVRDIPNFRHVR